MESERLETRLGPLAWRSSGQGPTLVFFAGALANGDLWRDVAGALQDRSRCITIDLPWERILGRCPREQTDRPPRWLGCCSTAWSCLTWRMPPWSPTTRPVDSSCCRWPLVIRRSSEWAGSCSRTVTTTTSSHRTRSERGRRCAAHSPDWPEHCFGYSFDRRPAGASSSPASPRAGWTASARNRSSGQHDVIDGWSTTSSRPWLVSDRNSSSMPPSRSPGSTCRSC